MQTLKGSKLSYFAFGLGAGPALCLAMACGEAAEQAESAQTDELYAYLGAKSEAKQTIVYGFFADGEKYPISVDNGAMRATLGNDSDPMFADPSIEGFSTVFFDSQANDVTISFTRKGEILAPRSRGVLPAAFTPVLAQRRVRRDHPVVITLGRAQPETELSYTYHGDCIVGGAGTLEDADTITLPTLIPKDTGENASCEVSVTLQRTAHGTVDSAFSKGGEFRLERTSSITFESIPAGN